ncbi:hypothetical protein T439DRAFT_92859 [Meredithblackwellia eburnea MCA 4105]
MMKLVIGTHSNKIHVLSYSHSSLKLLETTTLEPQPSWIAQSPTHNNLLYINSWENNKLFACKLNHDGSLDVLDTTETGGEGPTHFVVTKDGKAIVVAMYMGGCIAHIPLIPTTGLFSKPSPRPSMILKFPFSPPPTSPNSRQDASHPHHPG